jgi:hypothetical protein
MPIRNVSLEGLRLGNSTGRWNTIGSLETAQIRIVRLDGSAVDADEVIVNANGGSELRIRIRNNTIEEMHSGASLNGKEVFIQISYVDQTQTLLGIRERPRIRLR